MKVPEGITIKQDEIAGELSYEHHDELDESANNHSKTKVFYKI
jgi:hypothetical protein